jgi:hypothetical protein
MTEETQPCPARRRTCASCGNWDVRIARTDALKDSVAKCVLSPFAELHLVVSGAGGCDRWEPAKILCCQAGHRSGLQRFD